MREQRPARSHRARIAVLAAAITLTGTACSSVDTPAATVTAATVTHAAGLDATSGTGSGWESVLAQANGQSVNWYMYGGDETLNAFVNGFIADQLRAVGVTLNQVKITDTVDAVNKVLGEVQAGRTQDGSVDAIWVNGENFATGVQANLWSCGWDKTLPNSQFVDFTDPAVANDFGVAVNGCEAVWQQADSALVYDSDKLGAADVASISALLDWARANPGRFTYPAPPDFTGSMVVRTMLYDTIGGPTTLAGPFDETKYSAAAAKLWPRLTAIAGSLWRGGDTYPQSQSAVEKLYSDGEISAFFTYGPGTVGDQVDKGLYPASTRQAVPAGGNIGNRSFVAIPANAAHQAAAMVLANVLQDPTTQLELLKSSGVYPGIDVSKTSPEVQAQFAAVSVHPSVLPLAALTENAQPELAAEYLSRIEKDWTTNVLQQ